MQNAIVVLFFVLTYLGMAAGRLPWLQVDRTGIALIGVILLLVTEATNMDSLIGSIDPETLFLLFALMIISAQFAASGFLDLCVQWLMALRGGPTVLLALTVAVCGGRGGFEARSGPCYIAKLVMVSTNRPAAECSGLRFSPAWRCSSRVRRPRACRCRRERPHRPRRRYGRRGVRAPSP